MKLTVNDTTSAITLLDNDKLFIPAYQRPYRWKGEKAKQLFVDVAEYLKSQNCDLTRIVNGNAKKNERIEYFTGATVTTLENETIMEIIDGQQRTTTFYLVAFIRYLISARLLRELVNAKDHRTLETVKKTIDARSVVFTQHKDFAELLELKSKVDEDALSFNDFFEETKSLIDSLTRENIVDCDWELKISYARNSISKKLTSALSQRCVLAVNEDYFELVEVVEDDFPSESYKTTLDSCLEWLSEEIDDKSTIAKLKKAESLLTNLLDAACVCNIRANNQEDAYTLFEILNDRSEPLKDLEIAKNLFYKFAFSSGGLEDKNTDSLLDLAEENWNSAFENGNIEDIVYLAGTMSVTKDFELDFKKGQLADLRKAIATKLTSISGYKLENVVENFSTYRELGQFVNQHYVHQHRAQAVISKIFDDSRNLQEIAFKYFLALKQNKIVALLAIILKGLESNCELQKEIALYSLLFSIKTLGSTDLLSNLKQIAKALDEDELVKAQIAALKEKIINLDVNNTYSNWSYSRSNHVTILKTALSLYAASNGEKLGYKHVDLRELPNWENPKEFDLDHIIPKSKFDDVIDVPKNRVNEGTHVNTLGNMMLLGSKVNRERKLNSIDFILGKPSKPSNELCSYTHELNIDNSKKNKYIEGIRDEIANYNIKKVTDKVSLSLIDSVKTFNLKLVNDLVSENL